MPSGVALGRRRWAPSPNGRVDWLHPLAAGLVELVGFHAGCPVSHATGLVGSPTNSVGRSASPIGGAVNATASTGAWSLANPRGSLLTGGPITYMIHARRASSGEANFSAFGGMPYGTSWVSPFGHAFMSAPSTGSTQNLGFQYSSTGAVYNQANWSGVVTHDVWQWHTVVLVPGTSITLYVNGVSSGSGTYVAGALANTPAAPSSPPAMVFCNVPAGSNGSPGGVAFAGFWNRALSPNEIAAVIADPFGMVRSA